MVTRIITAVIALTILLPFLIFSDTFMLLFFSGFLSVVAIYEILNCIGLSKNMWVSIPSYLMGIIMTLLTRVIPFDNEHYFALASVFYFVYLIYMMMTAVLSKGKIIINDIALIYIMTIYICIGFSSIVRLRDMKHGEYIYLLVFVSSWITDIFAYFIGSKFGKHKLIPDVSPKKSVEGAVAGSVFCTLFYVGYGFAVGRIFNVEPNYLPIVIVGLLTSVISQFGDLIASLIKRHYGIKDYGFMLPGHGGVLDRFDSVIAVAPFLYMTFIVSSFFELFA